jgi:hypothetical protein
MQNPWKLTNHKRTVSPIQPSLYRYEPTCSAPIAKRRPAYFAAGHDPAADHPDRPLVGVLGLNYATGTRLAEKSDAKPVPPPTAEAATPSTPGPWGNLEYIRILTEPPEQQVGGSFPIIDHANSRRSGRPPV